MPLLRPLRPWLIGALLAFISSASSLASAPATLSSSLSLQVCFHLKTSAWTTCPEFSYLTPPPHRLFLKCHFLSDTYLSQAPGLLSSSIPPILFSFSPYHLLIFHIYCLSPLECKHHANRNFWLFFFQRDPKIDT